MQDDYEILDSGDGRKLERFGKFVIVRPCSQALWRQTNPGLWQKADASFDREKGNNWQGRSALPKEWTINTSGLKFILSGTDFGHLGIFPEQRAQWKWIRETVSAAKRPVRVLNLFAYSGGSTLAAAQGGAEVCHLDASRGMVDWARRNAQANFLQNSPIRWITDDAHKFMKREIKRARKYDAVILDPPTFGRGASGEMYKIERDLHVTFELLEGLLSETPLFVLFSSHTPGLTCAVARNLLGQKFPKAAIDVGEMLLEGRQGAMSVPSGIYARAVFGK